MERVMRKMTTSSLPPSTSSEPPIDPDEVCGVCGDTRENHGDRHHKFSPNGDLVALPKAEPPRQRPPVHRDDVAIQAKSFATLIEVLVEKNLLDAKDVIRILMGQG